MWCIEKIYVFLVTYCKIFHPKSPFYEKVKMTTKGLQSLSLITVGPFDCNHTQVGTFITKNAYHIPKKKDAIQKIQKEWTHHKNQHWH